MRTSARSSFSLIIALIFVPNLYVSLQMLVLFSKCFFFLHQMSLIMLVFSNFRLMNEHCIFGGPPRPIPLPDDVCMQFIYRSNVLCGGPRGGVFARCGQKRTGGGQKQNFWRTSFMNDPYVSQ